MKLKSRNKIDPNFQMSSLTDIIFLLLIFFLLTSSLVSVNALEILLPSSSSTTSAKAGASIAITADKQYYYNKDKIDFKDLNGLLTNFKNTRSDEEEMVTLFAEKSVPLEEVVNVFDIAKNLELQIILATNPSK